MSGIDSTSLVSDLERAAQNLNSGGPDDGSAQQFVQDLLQALEGGDNSGADASGADDSQSSGGGDIMSDIMGGLGGLFGGGGGQSGGSGDSTLGGIGKVVSEVAPLALAFL